MNGLDGLRWPETQGNPKEDVVRLISVAVAAAIAFPVLVSMALAFGIAVASYGVVSAAGVSIPEELVRC